MNQESSNKNLMLSVIGALKEGDVEPLFAAAGADVTWTSNAPRQFFRFGGPRTGLAELKAHIALIFSQYHFIRFEPVIVVTEDEIVCGQFDIEAYHQRSCRIVRSGISIRWRVRDGKILEHESYFDTASVLMQQGDLVAA